MGADQRDLSGQPGPRRAPVRTCIGCRRRASPDELVRFTADADGRLVVGRGMPGRGAWLCVGEAQCLRLALRRRAFGRALRTMVAAESVAELAAELGLEVGDLPGATGR